MIGRATAWSWVVLMLTLTRLTPARAQLITDQEYPGARHLISDIVKAYPPGQYQLIGVGGSASVLVDVYNDLVPQSAGAIPLTGARGIIEDGDYGTLWSEVRNTPSLLAGIARESFPPAQLPTFRAHLDAAIEHFDKSKPILVVDVTHDGASLLMATETIKAMLPGRSVQALALDSMNSFRPPNGTYHVLNLGQSRYGHVVDTLAKLKFASWVPGWNPANPQSYVRGSPKRWVIRGYQESFGKIMESVRCEFLVKRL